MTDQQRINVTVGHQPIKVIVKEDVLGFQTPLILGGGWPFGANPNLVENIPQGTPTIIDRVFMPGKYRVVKWLLVISDSADSKSVSSEINAFVKGSNTEYTEFAIMGDVESVEYSINLEKVEDHVELTLTSFYSGLINVRTVKIGIFK